MGQIVLDQHTLICSYLRLLNDDASEAEIGIYADYMKSYSKAASNIREHGEIVQHPRTAAPITNPYMEVRDSAVKMLRTLKLNTGKLTAAPLFAVALMDNESEPEESDFFGMPGKNAEDAAREAQEHFEGGDVAHVLTPDGGGTKILLT